MLLFSYFIPIYFIACINCAAVVPALPPAASEAVSSSFSSSLSSSSSTTPLVVDSGARLEAVDKSMKELDELLCSKDIEIAEAEAAGDDVLEFKLLRERRPMQAERNRLWDERSALRDEEHRLIMEKIAKLKREHAMQQQGIIAYCWVCVF